MRRSCEQLAARSRLQAVKSRTNTVVHAILWQFVERCHG